MFSRSDRNPLPGAAALLALALLVTAVFSVDVARAARGVDYVDGHGMAATDNIEDPRQGGGGSMEGDPWGGEQREADSPVDGPIVHPTTSASVTSPGATSSLTSFWARLLVFLSAFAR